MRAQSRAQGRFDRSRLIRLRHGENKDVDHEVYQALIDADSMGLSAYLSPERTVRAFRRFWDNRSLVQEDFASIEPPPYFFDWLYHDYPIKPGVTLLDLHLQKRGRALQPAQAAVMRALRNTTTRLYEVMDSVGKNQLLIRDVITDEESELFEPEQTDDWTDLIFARIVHFAGDRSQSIFLLPIDPDAREVMETFYREDSAALFEQCPDLSPAEYWKNFGHTGFLFYDEEIAHRL